MPIAIKFGTLEETKDDLKVTIDNVVNNPNPLWKKGPADLTEADYNDFYRELYPMTFEDPLFNIHLNVDYPFNLTGVLYFPKLKKNLELQKNKIQLYSNQVFVTDSVEGIVPEFLMLLHGVLDSPDIPLNVSRSYLQADQNVKKISNHITKKVADKLEELCKSNREDYAKKWDDIKVFIDYGTLSEEKFGERSKKFMLFKNVAGEYFLFDEYLEKIKATQTDKDGKTVVLYTHSETEHHAYLENAKERGYDVLVLDSPLSSHLLNKLEQQNANVTFKRIDADTLDKLIAKEEAQVSKLSKEDEEKLKPVITSQVEAGKYTVVFESLSEKEKPMLITQSEFMRRMKEMQATGGGGMSMFGSMPENYNLVVNSNHPLISKILEEKDENVQKTLAKQAADLALLSQGLLKGKDLTEFINRSVDLIK